MFTGSIAPGPDLV